MNNGSCIIDAIIGEANSVAEANIASATARAEEITSAAQSKRSADLDALQAKTKTITDEIVNRKIMVANIDAKKQNLNNKMQIIDEVFAAAPDSIRLDKRYADFLKRLIEENTENGDTVIISKADAKIVNKTLLDSISKQKSIELSLAKDYGDFIGGVIISNSNYDKNLTLESIVKQLRNELEMETADVLFGKH